MPALQFLLLLFLLSTIPFTTASLYQPDSPVRQATPKTFALYTTQSTTPRVPTIIEFYAPWCGHCKSLQPQYTQLATRAKQQFEVVAVNCDDEKMKPICTQEKVQGFPTLKIYKADKISGGRKSEGTSNKNYQGARETDAMYQALVDALVDYTTKIRHQEGLDKFLAKPLPKSLVFSDKGTPATLLLVQAAKLYGRMEIGYIRSRETELITAYNVTTYPTIVTSGELTANGGTETWNARLEGNLSSKSIRKFLAKHAGDEATLKSMKANKQTAAKSDKKAESSKKSKKKSDDAEHEDL